MDAKCKELLTLVYNENGVSTEDDRVERFADDRGEGDDTINMCVKAGAIRQVGDHDTDCFSLVPWWWPYRNAQQALDLRGWTGP